MYRLTTLALLISLSSLSAQSRETGNLLPVPASVTFSTARLRIDTSLRVTTNGFTNQRLERSLVRAIQRLENRTTLQLRRSSDNQSPATILISVKEAGPAIPTLEQDESYELSVDASQAILKAQTVVGAIRGMETLLQLQKSDSVGFYFQGAMINDTPRLPWRGLNLDVSRHFYPVSTVERIIDGMASLKLNVLHWHLSDDQGFRVESRRYPKLQMLGSDGLYYTQAELKRVVDYASDRGIRVVPEFDVPGHTTAWLVGYPELGTTPGPYQIERRWGIFRPVLDPSKESTYRFLESFIGEMTAIFPDRYWHIGGDEVDPTEWKNSPTVQRWMKDEGLSTPHDAQTAFNSRLFKILSKLGREPVGWDEILQPNLPANGVIQAWTGQKKLVEAAQQNRRAILSQPWYLDHIKTAGEMYLADPLPSAEGLTVEQVKMVLGGEACMWAEYLTDETVDSRIFPRLGAIAERLWSPAIYRDVPDLYRRLQISSQQLGDLGLRHLGHQARMVNYFAAGDDAALFTDLLDFVRPKGFGNYGTNQLTPHTRLLDAAIPDPFTEARLLGAIARARQGDANAAAELQQAFARMTLFRTRLDLVRNRIPLTRDALPVAGALRDVGRIGQEAMEYLTNQVRPESAWLTTADSTLARNRGRTFGLLRPVGVEVVTELVRVIRN